MGSIRKNRGSVTVFVSLMLAVLLFFFQAGLQSARSAFLRSQAEEALEDSGELVILRVSEEEDEDGEQYLDAIDNEEEYNRVAELFMGRLEDYFDFEDGEAAE